MPSTERTWKAGVASSVITPAESMWLAGWAVRTEPSRDTLTEVNGLVELLHLLVHHLHEILREHFGMSCDIEDVFLRVQGGELPA